MSLEWKFHVIRHPSKLSSQRTCLLRSLVSAGLRLTMPSIPLSSFNSRRNNASPNLETITSSHILPSLRPSAPDLLRLLPASPHLPSPHYPSFLHYRHRTCSSSEAYRFGTCIHHAICWWCKRKSEWNVGEGEEKERKGRAGGECTEGGGMGWGKRCCRGLGMGWTRYVNFLIIYSDHMFLC